MVERDWRSGWVGSGGELPLVQLATILAAVLVWLDAPLGVRVPAGLLATLFLPGYSLEAALFPRADDLGGAERLALAFGLSLAVIAVLALGLSYTPWGLGTAPIALALTGWTLLATNAAWWRRRRLEPPARFSVVPPAHPSRRASHGIWQATAALVAILVVAMTALTLTLTAPPPPATEFFVLGPEGLTEGYPREAQSGEPILVTVGVTNRESEAIRYRVVAESDTAVLARTGEVEVAAGVTWLESIGLSAPPAGKDQEIRLTLFKHGDTEPYRQMRLWLDVRSVNHSQGWVEVGCAKG